MSFNARNYPAVVDVSENRDVCIGAAEHILCDYPQIMMADFFRMDFNFNIALNEIGMPDCNDWRWELFRLYLKNSFSMGLALGDFSPDELKNQIVRGNPAGVEMLVEDQSWRKIMEKSFDRPSNGSLEKLVKYSSDKFPQFKERDISHFKHGLLYGYSPVTGEFLFNSQDSGALWIPREEEERSLLRAAYLDFNL